jgi:ABC-type phosphate transport system substrate-binding protein
MSRATRPLATAGVTVLAVALAGCGVDIGASATQTAPTAAQSHGASAQRARQQRAASLPTRAAGTLSIAGERQGSVSANATTDYASAQQRVRPRYSAVGATEGFARLCRGEVDVVDSARPISRAELAVCNANGLEIRTPIQIASDALVLATRNDSDVGGDCLSVGDVRDIYRRGSTIGNWNELGYDDLPLKPVGPGANANAFSFFASQVLGVPSGATLADLRSDYMPHSSDNAIRRVILGTDAVRHVAQLVEQEVARARAAQAGSRRSAGAKPVAAARARVLSAIAAENRHRVYLKQAVADPAGLAQRNRRRVAAAQRRAGDRAGATFDRRFTTLRATRSRELLARARRSGAVGFVRFSYYETYEDQLRPLEIDAGAAQDAALAAADARARDAGAPPAKRLPAADSTGNRTPNCIFPSQLTITTGEYPLSRRILLYTSTRGLRRSEVRSYLVYTLRNAQQLATRSRLVPITDALRSQQYQFLTGSKAPPPAEQPTDATTTARVASSASANGRTTTTGATKTPRSGVPGASTSVSPTTTPSR